MRINFSFFSLVFLIFIVFYVSPAWTQIDYSNVKIGEQIWMTENLNETHYNNGDIIPQVQDANEWKNLTTGAWCYYEFKGKEYKEAGKLYNWYAVMDPRGLAPTGWHIPSDAEWKILADFLGGDETAGSKMRITWDKEGTNGSNESGFTGLPGGHRDKNGKFFNNGVTGYWWSTTEFKGEIVWIRQLDAFTDSFSKYKDYKTSGLSIRCLK